MKHRHKLSAEEKKKRRSLVKLILLLIVFGPAILIALRRMGIKTKHKKKGQNRLLESAYLFHEHKLLKKPYTPEAHDAAINALQHAPGAKHYDEHADGDIWSTIIEAVINFFKGLFKAISKAAKKKLAAKGNNNPTDAEIERESLNLKPGDVANEGLDQTDLDMHKLNVHESKRKGLKSFAFNPMYIGAALAVGLAAWFVLKKK